MTIPPLAEVFASNRYPVQAVKTRLELHYAWEATDFGPVGEAVRLEGNDRVRQAIRAVAAELDFSKDIGDEPNDSHLELIAGSGGGALLQISHSDLAAVLEMLPHRTPAAFVQVVEALDMNDAAALTELKATLASVEEYRLSISPSSPSDICARIYEVIAGRALGSPLEEVHFLPRHESLHGIAAQVIAARHGLGFVPRRDRTNDTVLQLIEVLEAVDRRLEGEFLTAFLKKTAFTARAKASLLEAVRCDEDLEGENSNEFARLRRIGQMVVSTTGKLGNAGRVSAKMHSDHPKSAADFAKRRSEFESKLGPMVAHQRVPLDAFAVAADRWLPRVRAALLGGTLFDVADPEGFTPLMRVVMLADGAAAQMLVQSGVDVNAEYVPSSQPAARARALSLLDPPFRPHVLDCARVLCEAGAQEGERDATLFHHAAAQGSTDMLKLLHKHRLSTSEPAKGGETTVYWGRTPRMSSNPVTNVPLAGRTPLELARDGERWEAVRFLESLS
jgi:hypothetical protein